MWLRLRRREQRQHGGSKAFAQRDMKKRKILWRAARNAIDDRAPLGRGVRLLTKRDQLGRGKRRRVLPQAYQRGRYAVERSTGHDADRERVGHERDVTGGGFPTTCRTY